LSPKPESRGAAKPRPVLRWPGWGLFLLLFALQALPPIFENSPTADEPGDLTGGYFYWRGDVVSDFAHPPLAKTLQALPLRWMDLRDRLDPWVGDYLARTYDFFFQLNRGHFEAMLWAGRLVSLLFGLGLGALLFFASRKAPPLERLAVMALFAFEPTLLAFSGLAVSDLPLAFFCLAAVLAFQRHLEKPGAPWALGAGLLAAMAATCKFSGLALLPIFAVLEFLAKPPKPAKPRRWKKDWAWGALAFFAWIFVLYLPGSLGLSPFALPWFYFLGGLMDMVGQTQAFHATYFFGVAGHQNHGLYYPAAFLLKSTLPFLILLGLSLGLAARRKLSFDDWVWIPALFFFAAILPVQNLGVRYLLPAMPFLILLAARSAGWLWALKTRQAPRAGKFILGGLLVWGAATALLNNGNLLSYFNDLVPAQKKIYFLSDSNLDWGQDEKRLAQTAARRGWTHIKAAQLGGADLSLYGLKVQGWTKRDFYGPQSGWVYVVNVGFLQLGPVFYPDLQPLAISWMSTLPPTGRVGDTWLYWEIPGTPPLDRSDPEPSLLTAGARYQALLQGPPGP